MILTILLFIFILGIVVLTHEFGHFYVAKKSGMRVDEFGFGFPPKLFSFKKGETTYSFNLFPIGGFVKIYGEDGAERNEPRSFSGSSMWKRMAVIVAGVAMNFLVAYLFFSAVHMVGAPTSIGDSQDVETSGTLKETFIMVLGVSDDSPAEISGIEMGDRIVGLGVDDDIIEPEARAEIQEFINDQKGNEVTFLILRGGETLEKNVLVRDDYPKINISRVREKKSFFGQELYPAFEAGLRSGDKLVSMSSGDEVLETDSVEEAHEFVQTHKSHGISFTVERDGNILDVDIPAIEDSESPIGVVFSEEGPTGLIYDRLGIIQHAPHVALLEGGKTTYNLTAMSVSVFSQTIQQAFTEREVPEGIAGPLGIAVITGTVRDMGFVYILHFIALISMSLGLINILPFPALDGGRLAFLVAEAIKGSPVDKKFEGYAHMIGFALLILLIILITYHDITRYL